MRELHVVAVSEDGRHVLLGATKGKASHRVRLDARLVSAVRGELGADTHADLSPKEIQARLRAGESAESIATSAGMALTRVERFAGPVAGEMARMIDEARDGFVVRGRLGRSATALGRAVDAQLGDQAKAATWTTHREDDGRWRVQVAWVARGRAKQAAWRYDPHTRALDSVDPASAALGHVDANATPRRTPVRTAPAPASTPGEGRKAAAPKPTTKKPATPKPTAKKASATTAKAPPPPAKKRATTAAPAPAKKAGAKKTTAPAAKRAAPASPATTRKAAKRPARPRLQVVPDPPSVAKPATARAKATAADERDGVKGRASVPAWADVLLGTTPSNDR